MTDKYDLLYNPRFIVSNFQAITQGWTERSAKTRATQDCHLDIPYGSDATEKLDVFRARGESKALLIFIHGGYWRGFDKKDFSFVAPALTEAGITVAVPNYALCPKVTVEDIVRQMVQATAWLYRNGVNFGAPRHRLYVCGHSAGGHLTAMMLAALWPIYAGDLPKQVVNAGLSISGLYDLTEIMKTPSLNSDIRLTEESARKVSPITYPPVAGVPLYTAVGSEENEGFHIQNRLIMSKWKSVHKADIPCPGDNHFTVLDRLTEPSSALFKATMKMMEVA
jgi:arylformamidase